MKLRVSDNENVARVVVSLYKKGSIKAIETETIKPNVNDYQIEKMFNIIEPGKYYITVRAYDNVFNREYKQIKYFTVVEPEIPIVEYSIQFNVDSDKGTTTDTTVFKGIEGKTYFDENIVAPVVTAKSGFEFEGWDPVFIETDKIESD